MQGPLTRFCTGAAPRSLVRSVPIAAFLASAALVAWRDFGSIDAADWLPYAVGLGLVVAVVALSGAAFAPGRVEAAGVAALLALAAWVAISVTWSPLPSLARDEALLTALYALTLWTPLVTLRDAVDRRTAIALLVCVLGALAIATELRLRFVAHPADLYISGRLDSPVTYPNADAAFFLVGFWPAIGLAARRTWPALARAGALGLATALLAGWLLAQSKGGAVALVVSALVFFAICPARLRALVPTLVAAGLVGAAFQPLTAPYRAGDTELTATVRHAGAVALVLVAIAATAGLVYALVDRRLEIGRRAHRLLGAVTIAALVAALAGGGVAFATSVDRPGHWMAKQWRSFKTLPTQRQGATHLFALGSNRYDFWRVAVKTFERHPVAGVGGRGFRWVYLKEGKSIETPERAHSVELDELSETGLVGFVLLAFGLGLPLAVVLARGRRSLTTAAVGAGGVYWLAHSTVDWTWTFPAVSIPALLLIGIGAAPATGRPLPRRASIATGVVATALALFAFAPPWLSVRYTNRAYGDPVGAASDLRRARRLDPLSTAPYEAQAALARSPDDIPPLEAAVRKEPRQVELRFALGLAYLRAGRKVEARRTLQQALALYPRSEDIARALRRAR